MATTAQLITGTDFVAIPTHDIERAAEFYGQTLGLRRSVYMPDRHFAEFETGNLTLSVIEPDAMKIPYNAQHGISLHVEDVEETRKTLEARGVEFQGATFDTGVCHMAFFADPDGNNLMLHHRYAPRTPEA